MLKFLVVLTACVALARCGPVRREAASPALADLQKHAEEFQKTFAEQLNTLAGSENTAKLDKALKEGSDTILQRLSDFSKSLQSAMEDASGKARETIEKSRSELARLADQLQKEHPDVQQRADQLKTTIQSAVGTALEHTQKIAQEVAGNIDETNKKLAPKLKEAYDDFVKNAKKVQEDLHKAATDKA